MLNKQLYQVLAEPKKTLNMNLAVDIDQIDILFNKLSHIIGWNVIRNSMLNRKMDEYQ